MGAIFIMTNFSGYISKEAFAEADRVGELHDLTDSQRFAAAAIIQNILNDKSEVHSSKELSLEFGKSHTILAIAKEFDLKVVVDSKDLVKRSRELTLSECFVTKADLLKATEGKFILDTVEIFVDEVSDNIKLFGLYE